MRAIPGALSALVLAALAIAPGRGHAQVSPFQVEVRGGAAIPLGELRDPARGWSGDTGAGPGFGVSFSYNLAWYLAPYAGFSQHRFACPAESCGADTRLVATGFDVGIYFVADTGPVVPRIRAGLISYRVEGSVPGADGPVPVTSSRARGVEAGVGLAVRVAQRVTLAPGLRWNSMTPDFRGPGPLGMKYVTADLGLVLAF